MSFIHIGQKQLQAIDCAIQCLEGVTAKIRNQEESDVYRLVRPDFDEGLRIALMPYDSLLRTGALPWGDIPKSKIQDSFDDLNDAWEDLFSALTRRLADKTVLDLTRTKQECVHGIFEELAKAPPGTHIPQSKKIELDALCSAMSDISKTLCASDCVSRQETENNKTKIKRHNGRLGSGLKGSRTERMVEQLAEFKEWLRDNPVNERIATRTVGARASTYWRLHEKTFAKDATRAGEKRGFSSPKTLASAYRNSKA